jgi:hypothetical protein
MLAALLLHHRLASCITDIDCSTVVGELHIRAPEERISDQRLICKLRFGKASSIWGTMSDVHCGLHVPKLALFRMPRWILGVPACIRCF